MACTLEVKGRRHSGIVLDISRNGMFIQTNAKPDPGTPVTVELNAPGSKHSLVLRAIVARKKLVPPQLVTVAHGGLGLHVDDAPPAFLTLLGDRKRELEENPESTRERRKGDERAKSRFRVRAAQAGTSKTMSFLVVAASEEDARRRVLKESGEGWKILRVEPA